MTEQEANDLRNRYRTGNTTDEENQLLHAWYSNQLDQEGLHDYATDREATRKEIWASIAPEPVSRRLPVYVRYAAAAAIAAVITTGIFYFTQHKTQSSNLKAENIQPGGNKATLTLANGKTITLNTDSGLLAAMNPASGVVVSNNTRTGIVTFKFDSNSGKGVNPKNKNEVNVDQAAPNTIATPAGGQYQLILSDGTRVYLNAASKITFPSRFAGNTRTVSVLGEAYFEVSKDPNHPFIVTTSDQTITVLGTHFNVSAYSGEPVKTTLAEGSVRLSSLSSPNKQILKPNQQAVLDRSGFKVSDVVADDVIAWKSGVFKFVETPLSEAMQQIGRWYNVEIALHNLPDTPINANIRRDRNLEQVITALDRAGFTFNYNTKERRLIFVR
ncbi:FecR family protein [Chitinophaga rhizophila]|uniref:FecR domain-containing protein n=1 Tax=Chitinophaga rhizophila TaxID=2866212 RepID=A0ABS7GJE7_9BACT|nr:FecR family protein [Chitinophaga rhizophila]MBW8687245.1 FecR domain-containing protein [Chitinophaga rhizophila]